MITTKIPYTLTIDDESKVSIYRNIFLFRNTLNSLIENRDAVLRYIIKDSDTPRSLANVLYGSEQYDWIITTINNIVNPYYDWPLSEESFYEMIEEKYFGKQCFFLDLSTVTNNFVPGEIITQQNKTAEIVSWDRSLSKLTVKNVSSSFTTTTINSTSATATIKRIIEKSEDALHHFETSNGGILDPYIGFLELYLNGSDSYVITNKQNEEKENNKKRNIYILKPDFVLPVITTVTSGIISLEKAEILTEE